MKSSLVRNSLCLMITLLTAVILFFMVSGAGWSLMYGLPKQFKAQQIQGGFLSGQVLGSLQQNGNNTWLQARWDWCPELNPFNWCVQLDGENLNATLGVRLQPQGIQLHQSSIQLTDLGFSTPGLATIELNVAADIDQASFHWGSNFPEHLVGRMELSNIRAMHKDWPSISTRLTTEGSGKNTQLLTQLESEAVNGSIQLASNGRYTTDLRLNSAMFAEALGLQTVTNARVPLARSGQLSALLNR